MTTFETTKQNHSNAIIEGRFCLQHELDLSTGDKPKRSNGHVAKTSWFLIAGAVHQSTAMLSQKQNDISFSAKTTAHASSEGNTDKDNLS